MIQHIIVILIILGAISYSIYAVVKSLRTKNTAPCDDCFGCDAKQEILRSLKQKKLTTPYQCSDFKKKSELKYTGNN